ncbi:MULTISPECIES: penicillin-binding protein activator [Alcanivorax]|jgi:outer membrane PBP1 activator LpoA protein|uniref:penicillin-binding protein activator n=1 Tax=Alcanivorax TaxID=59753 RepID=UPI002408F2CB|nr:penicillin-binding protein activator [Alcanivorax jadensis]MDF1636679.1 penicillin-binding protein activator [Alcanivorax jadensis]
MEFRKARLAALLAAAVIAGCSTTTPTRTTVYEQPSAAKVGTAPTALSAARSQLATMKTDARIGAALQWAEHYLDQQRPGDAGQLLADLNPQAMDNEQRFTWILLSGRAQLGDQRPDDALALLQRHEDDILQYPAEQQAGLDLLKADALAMKGDLTGSLQQRVATHPLLEDEDQDYNHGMIWQLLMQLSSSELADAIEDSRGDLLGWLTLAQLYRDPIADLDAQVSRLNQWSAQWRTHPATDDVPDMLDALEKAVSERPSKVAILLPATGPLKNAGKALQEGIMTAYYRHKQDGNPPILRFYDSGGDDILALYQQAVQDGADFILGPLAKDKAATIANQGTLPVTTLALNYIDQGELPENFFQFGLAPEDEARQIALQGAREGASQAGILYPEGEWGERVAQAFAQEWQSLGGTVTVTRTYQEGPTLGDTVKELLLVAQSQSRGQAVSRFTSLDMDIQPRRRQDMGFLFLLANPNQGRQVKPALNFHYAKDLPVYSTALVHSGESNPRRDQDLNGVRFVDMPWMLSNEDSQLRRMSNEQWPEGHGRYERLFAMGIDAYRLQSRVFLLSTLPSSELPGVTGRLSMKQQRIVRELNWGVFINGEARALPKVAEPANNSRTREITAQ